MPSATGPLGTLEDRRARLVAVLRELRERPTSQRWAWLNSWKGAGAIVDGMTAQGYDVEIQQSPQGWWARFYLGGPSHTVCAGSGWAVTPWRAVQQAACETLRAASRQAHLDATAASGKAERPNPQGGPAGMLRRARGETMET